MPLGARGLSLAHFCFKGRPHFTSEKSPATDEAAQVLQYPSTNFPVSLDQFSSIPLPFSSIYAQDAKQSVYEGFMKVTLLRFLFVALFATLPASVFAQSPSGVQVRLLLGENKTTYRTGERISLVLEFTADRDGYQVEVTQDGWQPTMDVISLSPMTGVTRWLDEYLGADRLGRHSFLTQILSTIKPIRVEFPLNDTYRFDAPGEYSVQVSTRRLQSGSSSQFNEVLVTNRVQFKIEGMSEAEEREEVKRLSRLLDQAKDWQTEARLAQDLSFLTGNASTHEKVRRFIKADGRSGNYAHHIHFGLFIARNRALVLQLLEAAIRNENIPVTWSLLSTTSKLRMLRDYSNASSTKTPLAMTIGSPNADPRMVQIQQAYLSELAASLSKRVGNSQTTTATTILMNLPKETESSNPVLMEVLTVLRQQFDSLDVFSQEYLLRQYWERLKDPSLVASLEKMLGYVGQSNKNVHDTALKALLDIAPDKARKYVIAEIRDPQSLVEYDLLQSLPDKSLPEVDAALLLQLQTHAASRVNFDRVHLKHKATLAARYASAHIYSEMIEFYKTNGPKLDLETRAALLAYVAKHNEPEALVSIEEILANLRPDQDFNFLPQFTRLYYSDAIDAILRKRLDSDEPSVASTAAYLISLHGPTANQKVLEARLERWKQRWSERSAEANTNSQGRVEREIIMALGNAKSWKISPERYKELQRGCVTKMCREHFRVE